MSDRILTVRQPWATAIIRAGKNIENRTWYTEYRGRLWIHAGKTWDDSPRAQAFIEEFDNLKRLERDVGHVLGSVQLVDVVRGSLSEWARPGRFHWVLWQPVALRKPIPRKGNRGLTEYSP